MADIRVERKGGSKVWQWVLLVLVVLVLAAVLAYFTGYLQLPAELSTVGLQQSAVAQLVLSGRVPV